MLKILKDRNPSALRWIWFAFFIGLLDQGTKFLATLYLQLNEPNPIIPGFNLTLAYNTGAAFSFLGDASGWQRWFFMGITSFIILLFCLWLFRLPAKLRFDSFGLLLVVGGALGNLWDRVNLGYVVDFIQIYYKQWSWPVFNLADSAICIGTVFIIVGLMRDPRKSKG